MNYNICDEKNMNDKPVSINVRYAKQKELFKYLTIPNTSIYGVRYVNSGHKIYGHSLDSDPVIDDMLSNINVDKDISGFVLVLRTFNLDDGSDTWTFVKCISTLPTEGDMENYFKNTFYNTNVPDMGKEITAVSTYYGNFYTNCSNLIWVKIGIRLYSMICSINTIMIDASIHTVSKLGEYCKSDFGLLLRLNMTTAEFCNKYRVGYDETKINGNVPMKRELKNTRLYDPAYNKYYDAGIVKLYSCPYNQNLINIWFDYNNLMLNLPEITCEELDHVSEIMSLINEVGDNEWEKLNNLK